MKKYDLSTIEKIQTIAEEIKKTVGSDPFDYNARWTYEAGYAAALKDVAEQLKTLPTSIEVLVCIYENHHSRMVNVSAYPTADLAYSSVDKVKEDMGFNEEEASDDEIFDYDVYGFKADALAKTADETLLSKAKKLIDDFCIEEHEDNADFTDLENFRIERYLDGILFDSRQYDSLQTLVENELEHLDYSDLIHITDEQIAMAQQHEEECQ